MKLKCVHRTKWFLQYRVFSGSCPLEAVSAAKRKRSGTMQVAKDWFKEDVYTEELLTATDMISWHSLVIGMEKRCEKDITEVTEVLFFIFYFLLVRCKYNCRSLAYHKCKQHGHPHALFAAVWLSRNSKSFGTPSFQCHGRLQPYERFTWKIPYCLTPHYRYRWPHGFGKKKL